MKKIPLTHGKYALVDDEDFEYLKYWKWLYMQVGYAASHMNEKNTLLYMHRIIMKPKKGLEVDHINGDKLDNQRSNLRVCNSSQNKCNKPVQANNKLGIKGIIWSEERKRYVPQLCVNKKRVYLGRYKSLEEAVRVYREAAIKHHGEFARVNL